MSPYPGCDLHDSSRDFERQIRSFREHNAIRFQTFNWNSAVGQLSAKSIRNFCGRSPGGDVAVTLSILSNVTATRSVDQRMPLAL
jgi:hypothetical protein